MLFCQLVYRFPASCMGMLAVAENTMWQLNVDILALRKWSGGQLWYQWPFPSIENTQILCTLLIIDKSKQIMLLDSRFQIFQYFHIWPPVVSVQLHIMSKEGKRRRKPTSQFYNNLPQVRSTCFQHTSLIPLICRVCRAYLQYCLTLKSVIDMCISPTWDSLLVSLKLFMCFLGGPQFQERSKSAALQDRWRSPPQSDADTWSQEASQRWCQAVTGG